MIAVLNTINLNDAHYATELAYATKVPPDPQYAIHHFIKHPGADESDALFLDLEPTYKAPVRYMPLVVLGTFFDDYAMMSKGEAVFMLRDQIKLMRGFISTYLVIEQPPIVQIAAIEDYYQPAVIAATLSTMEQVRHGRIRP